MIAPGRVAAAEYAKRRVLATVTETRFGSFVHDAAHDHRAPATQLLDTRLPSRSGAEPPAEPPTRADPAVEALLSRIDSLYERHGLRHRVLSGVDRETFARLAPVLRNRGYEREVYWALVPTLHDDSESGPPDLRIEVKPHGSDDARAVHEAVGRDPEGIAYIAEAAQALDGTELVGYLRGEPIGVAGWYCHGDAENGCADGRPTEDGRSDDQTTEGSRAGDRPTDGGCADDRPTDAVARYTHVGVHPDARDQGVGSALVAAVVERCPLAPGRQVVCATAETAGFYERCGFTRNNHLWRFARLP